MTHEPTPAESAMQQRLVEWGNIMLRGRSGKDTPALFESDSQRKLVWTGKQREAAEDLHRLVIALPELRLVIALQVIYRAGELSYWADIPVPRQRRIVWELTREVNARIITACRERRIAPQYIVANDLMRHRDRAIRMLIAAEREALQPARLIAAPIVAPVVPLASSVEAVPVPPARAPARARGSGTR